MKLSQLIDILQVNADNMEGDPEVKVWICGIEGYVSTVNWEIESKEKIDTILGVSLGLKTGR